MLRLFCWWLSERWRELEQKVFSLINISTRRQAVFVCRQQQVGLDCKFNRLYSLPKVNVYYIHICMAKGCRSFVAAATAMLDVESIYICYISQASWSFGRQLSDFCAWDTRRCIPKITRHNSVCCARYTRQVQQTEAKSCWPLLP